MNIFSEGDVFTPETPVSKEEVIFVRRFGDEIRILLPVEGDHPTLITINLDKKSFDVEGYD